MVWLGRAVIIALFLNCVILIIWGVNDINLQPTNAWQPWVTGLGVIAAVFLSVWQQHKIDERETKQRKRKSVASRAAMPAALAEICQYADECAEKVIELYPHNAEVSVVAGRFPVPKFPTELIKVLQDCIEHAEEEDAARIAECIRKLQIQHSRLSKLLSKSTIKHAIKHSFDSIIIDTIELNA